MDDCSKKSEEFIEEIEELVSYIEEGGRDRTDGEQGDGSVQDFESELREIFEHTAVGMYRTTPDGRILMANPALVRMLGFSSFEELAQRSLGESGFEPDYPRKLFRERIEKEGKIVGLESVWMTRQGNRLVIIENARVVCDQDQNVLYYEGTAEDITERKQAEDELRSSQERLKILFESAPDGIFLYDLEGGVVDGNKASEELVGYARDELIGKNFGETGLLSSEQMPKAIENLRKNVQGKPTGPDEFTLRRKDGGSVTVEIRAFPVTIDGQALLLGIARDITQRKRAEEVLDQSEKTARALLNATTDSGLLIDREGLIIDLNEQMAKALGGTRESMIGTIVYGYLPADLAEQRKAKAWEAERTGKSVRFEDRRGDRWLENNVYPVFDAQGRATRFAIYSRDITARKRAEEAIEERLRFERMLSTISGRFVSLAVDEIDKAIEDGLGLVGEFFGVDRVTISQLIDEEKETRRRHVWLSEKFRQGSSIFDRDATYPHVAAYLRRKGAFVYNKPEELPKGWKEEREFVRASGVKSGVIVPLRVGGAFLGAISINSLDSERVWLDGTVERLALVGEILANALDRKRVEEALWESEAMLSKSQAIAHVGSWELDLVTNRLTWSDEVYRMFGLRHQEFDGTYEAFLDTVHPGDRAAVDAAYSGSLHEGSDSYEIEHRIVRRDSGEVRMVYEKCEHVKDASGRIVCSVGMVQDITERKRAEEALRESEERYRSFLENFHGIAYRGLMASNPTFFHGAVEEITGYGADDFVGANPRWDQIIHKDDFAEIMKMSGKRIAEIPGTMEEREYRVIRKDGRIRWVREFVRNICDDHGKPAFVEGVIYDITPQREAKKALEESERFLGDIFDAIQDGMSILDCDLNIVRVNEWMEKMYAAQMPLVGKKCYEVYQHRQSSCPWCPSLSTIETGNVCTVTVPYPCAENPTGWIELSAFPLKDANGCAVGVIEYVKDVTQRKEAEEKAREHQSELAHVWRVNTMGEMASGLAHELNQPLCAILNYANACLRTIRRQVDVYGELADPVEQIATLTERAGEIIKRIRGLVAKREPHTSAADINGIVREVAEMEKSEADLKSITMQAELAEDLPQVFVDSVEIEEVILNLVRNAFDAMSDVSVERREVTIVTGMTKSGEVEVCVRDTGKGLAGLGVEKIFDSFFTTKVDGLGIGLSISRTIVETHGGKLWAESNPDCGASFRFTLPVKGADDMYCEDNEESVSNGENL